jgi:CheY-like chemotaxis protein
MELRAETMTTARPIAGMRILIVDDDADTVEAVCELLKMKGAEVVFASSAAAALAEVDRFSPHLLISDMSMPNLDGCDLIQNIRAAERDHRLFALVLSAHDGAAHRDRAFHHGFDGYLTKPTDLPVLVKAIVALTHWPLTRAVP